MRVLSKVLSVRSSVIAMAVALSVSGVAGRAHAETLADAITAAYQSNPNIQAQRAAMRALDENYAQARAAYGLQASAQVSEGYSYQKGVESGRSEDATQPTSQLSVSQALYTNGRYAARLASTEAQIKAARENLRRIEMDLLVRVTNAYVSVRRDREVLRISEGGEAFLRKQLQDTQDKYSVRQVTLTDVQQSKARLAAASTQLANAQAQLNVSVAFYASLVGHLPDTLDPEPDIDGLPPTLDEAFDQAEQNNPSLLAAAYTEKSSREGVAEARAQRLFSVSARADYRNGPYVSYNGKAGNRVDNVTASVTLSQPLFSSGQLNSAVRQSIEENNRDKLLIDDARRNMVLGVSQYWDQLVAARKALVSTEEEMKADTIAFYGVREEERFALRSTIEILNAQAELQNAQISFMRGRANEYIGRVQLLAQVGTLEVGNLAPGIQPYDPERHFKKVRYKGVLPTDLIVQSIDKIALPMEPKKPKAGDTTPIRPPSSELPAKPVPADQVKPPQSINDLPTLNDDAPVKTSPRN
ncbi:TolC family outer membrane protein [Caulobacter sp. RL271]|jgi:outer membrane protein/S-layer protein transport system outer membrane protein|uniref:TolC family outer membrane protein n=1 Tax=Caulobacter segnis TaxID=88688 RepID=A0ABY4ZY01_9CAUL|nr:TolC family outer membrane protein [Caulobacter segnis]USQ97436.1 TolC family outer membrane protein [Caulobacter segnis]